jgi:hypothetical protein
MEDWLDTECCECGGSVFKYFNSSKGSYVMKCGIVKELYDPKLKKWYSNKKKTCDFFKEFVFVERSVQKEPKEELELINLFSKLTIPQVPKEESKEDKINRLMDYYELSKQEVILQEVELIRNKQLVVNDSFTKSLDKYNIIKNIPFFDFLKVPLVNTNSVKLKKKNTKKKINNISVSYFVDIQGESEQEISDDEHSNKISDSENEEDSVVDSDQESEQEEILPSEEDEYVESDTNDYSNDYD